MNNQDYPREFEDGIKPKLVCLCGSTRFIECFAIVTWELEKEGYIVMGCHYMPPGYPTNHLAEAEGCKDTLDKLHFRKIELADYVVVLNVNGYIGWSTRNEIDYATKLGKPIFYLEGGRNNEIYSAYEFNKVLG